ncbi:MAG: hypothetical protein RBG13Loki_0172 [Promethearchaeota archaeon CR_4]|nr:MAG: hypothetical protein RBG13Loki_0172 [Candidatus Lokiarchaeota archaeon CR_4]
MDARNLWRVRLELLIVVFLIFVLVPNYLSFGESGNFQIFWYWGGFFVGYPEISLQFLPWWYALSQMVINPIFPLIIGIIGCVLTRRCVMRDVEISKTARILTQMSVMGSFIIALYLISMSRMINIPGIGVDINIYFSAICVLPITFVLAFLSYDFPRFRALDFGQQLSSTGETRRVIPNLWRKRLILMILVFCLLVFVPYFQKGEEIIFLSWYWGIICLPSCSSVTIIQSPWWLILLRMSILILPLIIGIWGCLLTKHDQSSAIKISRTARLLTQISVTASLFFVLYNLITPFFVSIASFYLGWWRSDYLYIPIDILCALPVIIILAFISYDIPSFRARDFTQTAVTSERVPEEQKSLPIG